MTAFIAAAAVLTLAAIAIVLRALRPQRARPAADAARANRDALAEQLQQLDADLAAGELDPAAHARSRAELERRLLDEVRADAPATPAAGRVTGWVLALVLPLLAVGLYLRLGNPAALAPPAPIAQAGGSAHDLEALVDQLAERMARQPPGRMEDLEGWVMLGRSYALLQRYPQAAAAFTQALKLAPDDPRLLADQAEVTAMLPRESAQADALRLLERALRIDPAQPKALALAGSAAFARQDYRAALGYWERARAGAPPDSEFALGLDRAIAEARTLANAGPAGPARRAAAPTAQAGDSATAGGANPAAGGEDARGAAARAARSGSPGGEAAGASADGEAAGSGAAGAAASIRGRVSLAPALAARVSPDDTVFVFARAVSGPRAPLAILRRPASALPFDFSLDDSQSMAPQLKLSAFPEVIVGVRVSRSGNALPASGDLEGEAGPMPNHARGLALTIDRVRP